MFCQSNAHTPHYSYTMAIQANCVMVLVERRIGFLVSFWKIFYIFNG